MCDPTSKEELRPRSFGNTKYESVPSSPQKKVQAKHCAVDESSYLPPAAETGPDRCMNPRVFLSLSACGQGSGRREKSECLSTAGLAASTAPRQCQDGPAVKGSSCQCHDPTTTRGCYFPPLADSSPWLCCRGSAAPPCPAPQRAARLGCFGTALAGHDSARCGRQLCSVLLLGRLATPRPVRGASKIMEDSLQRRLWSHPWVSFATPLL